MAPEFSKSSLGKYYQHLSTTTYLFNLLGLTTRCLVDCHSFLLRGNVIEMMILGYKKEVQEIISERASYLATAIKRYSVQAHLFFDNIDKTSFETSKNPKLQQERHLAKIQIISFAKELLKGHGHNFETVLWDCDSQVIFTYLWYSLMQERVLVMSHDNDYGAMGLKAVRFDPVNWEKYRDILRQVEAFLKEKGQYSKHSSVGDKKQGWHGEVSYIDLKHITIDQGDTNSKNLIQIAQSPRKAALLFALFLVSNDLNHGKDPKILIRIAAEGDSGKTLKQNIKKICKQDVNLKDLLKKIHRKQYQLCLCRIVFNKITKLQTFMFLTHAQNYSNDTGIYPQQLLQKLCKRKDIKSFLQQEERKDQEIIGIIPDPEQIKRIQKMLEMGQLKQSRPQKWKFELKDLRYNKIPNFDDFIVDQELDNKKIMEVEKIWA